MKLKISFLAALLLAGSLVATDAAIASENVLSKQVRAEIQPSGETAQEAGSLRRLASALSSGREAVRSFHGSRNENNGEKARLNPPVPGMECDIDLVASYVSCFSSLIDAEEAETLFTRLVDELQATLPPNSWRGMKKQPGIASIRSYSYADQKSSAHIDIDIIDRTGLGEQSSYIVSIFGWTY